MMIPEFMVETLMEGLSDLKDGWDSYNGKAPTTEALTTARACLAGIHVSPLSDGGLQIDLGDAEVVIDPHGKIAREP